MQSCIDPLQYFKIFCVIPANKVNQKRSLIFLPKALSQGILYLIKNFEDMHSYYNKSDQFITLSVLDSTTQSGVSCHPISFKFLYFLYESLITCDFHLLGFKLYYRVSPRSLHHKDTPAFFGTPLGRGDFWIQYLLTFLLKKSIKITNGKRLQGYNKPGHRRRSFQQSLGYASSGATETSACFNQLHKHPAQ